MTSLIEQMLMIAFTIGTEPVSWLEIIGFVSGAACVWLTVKQHALNWPVGLIQVIAYILLFIDAKLYADAALQFVYVVLGIWGWINWTRKLSHLDLKPRVSTFRELALQLTVLLVLTAVLWQWLHSRTDSTSALPDAFTTALSLVATYGQAKKLIESWYFWILADIVYVPLYFSKHLPLTAVLYGGFLALCVMGLQSWRKSALVRAPEVVSA